MIESEVLERYRLLPYRRKIEKVREEDGVYFIVRYPDLPGLAADGETRMEAIKNAQDAFDDYIIARYNRDDLPSVPEGSDRILRAVSSEPTEFLRARQQRVERAYGQDVTVSRRDSETGTEAGDTITEELDSISA